MMIPIGLGAYSPPPPNIQSVLQTASASSGVPINILQALAYEESRYKPEAVSPAGAQGLLQIMPATGASLGLSNPFDAQQNANVGASYLASLYSQFGNWNDALVAYNEGPGAFRKSGAYPSSAQYASDILTNAGDLSSSPISADNSIPAGSPDLPTDSYPVVDSGSFLSNLTPAEIGIGAVGLLVLVLITRR